MSNIAILLAGGTGSRLGAELPKQFLEVQGKTIIGYSIDAFEKHPDIDEIAIVIHPDYRSMMEELIIHSGWKKIKHLLSGGSERYHSSLAAINAYQHDRDANLIIHDAVRPLVSQAIISRTVEALKDHRAINVVVPVVDTIFEVSGNYLHAVPCRTHLRRAQTPQAFHISTIREAYQRGMNDPHFKPTDDCSVVLTYLPDTPIFMVEGEERNLKLTYKEDLYIIEHLLQQDHVH